MKAIPACSSQLDISEQIEKWRLEIRVNDLDAGCAHAQVCGARLTGFQPLAVVHVHLDPDGRPFCLYLAE